MQRLPNSALVGDLSSRAVVLEMLSSPGNHDVHLFYHGAQHSVLHSPQTNAVVRGSELLLCYFAL